MKRAILIMCALAGCFSAQDPEDLQNEPELCQEVGGNLFGDPSFEDGSIWDLVGNAQATLVDAPVGLCGGALEVTVDADYGGIRQDVLLSPPLQPGDRFKASGYMKRLSGSTGGVSFLYSLVREDRSTMEGGLGAPSVVGEWLFFENEVVIDEGLPVESIIFHITKQSQVGAQTFLVDHAVLTVHR